MGGGYGAGDILCKKNATVFLSQKRIIMASPLVDSQFALFFSLSNYLTGEPVLDRELAQRHYSRLRSVSDPPVLAKLLLQWQAAQKNQAHTDRLVKKKTSSSFVGPMSKTPTPLPFTRATQKH